MCFFSDSLLFVDRCWLVVCERRYRSRCCASKNKWLNNPKCLIYRCVCLCFCSHFRYYYFVHYNLIVLINICNFLFFILIETSGTNFYCRMLKSQVLTMPPTQLSPSSTFHNSQTSNLLGLWDVPKSPTSSIIAGNNSQPSSAFPYFYSIPDNGSMIGVSNKNIFIRVARCLSKINATFVWTEVVLG